MNAVAQRELQERFRTLRSPILLGVWVLGAGIVTFLAYVVAQASARDLLDDLGLAGLGSVVASSSMGRFILQVILVGLLTAVVFVVPGQAAVTIVGERERQTLPLLQASQLSATGIVWGKLMSSLAYVLLLLVATVPMLMIPVLLGGTNFLQVVFGVGMVAAAAIMIGAVSTWVSARAKSIQGAVLGAYLWTAVLVFGTLGLLLAEIVVAAPSDFGRVRYQGGVERDDGRELYATWLNPYVGLVDASSDVLRFDEQLMVSPYEPFRLVLLRRQGYAFATGSDLGDPSATFGRGFVERGFERGFAEPGFIARRTVRSADPIRAGVWWRTLAFQGLVTAAAVFLAARRIRVPRRSILPARRQRRSAVAA